MRSFASISALPALLALASAASSSEPTSTVSIAFPGVNPTDLGLSVVTIAPSSTVYKVGCALKADGEPKNTDCHWVSGLNPWLTVAPTSFGLNITGGGDSATFECKVSSTSKADCTTIEKSGSNTHKETHKDITMTYSAATITAGLQKLQASATTTGSSSSGSSSSSSSGTSTATSTSGTATGASTTSAISSGGAAARETGMGLLAMAGAIGAGLVL